ncbi:hypothetical protein PG994_013723 [Apiospora phragmitis]|uniref:Clr5 domain-containing protein n=1 Tax=Apiospora phragmitis TaxID=2905665 RepID=A0ABR1T9H3_9PEZI
MPVDARKIPQAEWDRHQDIINALYHNQKLPLCHPKDDGRSNTEFPNSLSQYEAQLRRWDSQKNLKKHEWAFLLAQYDRLFARGCQVRIVSSGLPLSEARIATARRHLQSAGHKVSATSAPRHAFVEYQDDRGDWIRCSTASERARFGHPGSPRQSWTGLRAAANLEWPQYSPVTIGTSLAVHRESAGSTLIPILEPLSSNGDLVAWSTFNPFHDPIGPGADVFMHPIAQQILGTLSSLAPNNTGTSSLILCSSEAGNDIPTLVKAIAYSFSHRMELSVRTDQESVFELLKKSDSLRQDLQGLLQAVHPSFGMCLADNLFRHAVETDNSQAVNMVLHMARTIFTRGYYTPLDTASAKSNVELAHVLLRIGADPNHSYWGGYDHSQGALETALWIPQPSPFDLSVTKPPPLNIELVRILLNNQARVRPETLKLLLRRPLIEKRIVEGIISRIEVKDHELHFPTKAPKDLILKHSEHPILPNIRGSIQDIYQLVPDIVRILQNSTAASAIMSFFSRCDAAVCGPCAHRQKRKVLSMLLLAARRGNLELVEFILPIVSLASLEDLLVPAIRGGNMKLVNRLLQNGATVDGPASLLMHMEEFCLFNDKQRSFMIGTTPLAEAIWSQDELLIRRLEGLSALACIGPGKDTHFMAAATAAAFTGNLHYLRKLCERIPIQDRKLFTQPLSAAMADNQQEIVSFILTHTHADVQIAPWDYAPGPRGGHGSSVVFKIIASRFGRFTRTLLSAFSSQFPGGLPGFGSMALSRAIHDSNTYQITQLLAARMDITARVEVDFYINIDVMRNFIEEKVSGFADRLRKEKAIMEDLVGMGAFVHAVILEVRRSGNHLDMVRMVLEAGSDPNKYASRSPPETPFLLAIQYADMEVIELLVQWGADVNMRGVGMRDTPLQLACEQGSYEMVVFLLKNEADVRVAPSLAGGSTALQMAARAGNSKIAQLLIDNGADVHEPPSGARGRTAFEEAAKEGRITMLEFLWDQACPAGFPPAELQRARSFAEEEGYRGKYLGSFCPSATNPPIMGAGVVDVWCSQGNVKPAGIEDDSYAARD